MNIFTFLLCVCLAIFAVTNAFYSLCMFSIGSIEEFMLYAFLSLLCLLSMIVSGVFSR